MEDRTPAASRPAPGGCPGRGMESDERRRRGRQPQATFPYLPGRAARRRKLARPPELTVDLTDLGGALLDWQRRDPSVTDIAAAVQASDLAVVASPTYKATYTGLLKLFLDRIPGTARWLASPPSR